MGSRGRDIGSGDDGCEGEADVDEGAVKVMEAGAIDEAPPTAPTAPASWALALCTLTALRHINAAASHHL
jgi:hypothetical protein